MEPTARFFNALRKLAVTLESETVRLKDAFENRNDEDSEAATKAIRAYHQVNCDVGLLKGQIQSQVAQQKAQENEVNSFIQACRVMEKRVTKDVQTLKEHWEKYGYQAPEDTQKPTNQESKAEDRDEAADESETKLTGGEGENQEEAGVSPSSLPLTTGPPPFTDLLRTPQLSDFGLCELQMKRALAGLEWCTEVPPMPQLSLPHPTLNTPAPPPMPLTPKCALRMDDAELQTPQMPDFAFLEHTMCLNNDFTMDLRRKNMEKPQRPSQDKPVAPVNAVVESLSTKAQTLESPEPPVFYTPRFKIKKTDGPCDPPAQPDGDPNSPGCLGNLPTTPEVPVFQTPYLNRMANSRKQSSQPPEPVDTLADDDDDTAFDLPSPRNGAAASKRPWEYNVPDVSITGVEDKPMPEMPKLESVLGNSLQTRSAKLQKTAVGHKKENEEPTVGGLDLDGPTQEFSLGTPRIRTDYQDPSTPEMPDLSSVTQDICKLVSQARTKKTAMAVIQPNIRPENGKNRAVSLSVVSESEFQTLPKYLRQVTLHSLNQVILNINKFTEERQGDQMELRMEELRKICLVEIKTPIYIICLIELKRLEHIGGARNNSVYKLCTHH